MKLPLRRTVTIALVGGAAYAGWTWWSRREPAIEAAPPEWPPVDPPGDAPSTNGGPPIDTSFATTSADAAPEATARTLVGGTDSNGDRAWTEPGDDGSCPVDFPIKANDNSGIFHVPGGRFYDRTGPERCYRDAADAIADGYRQAKS